jgi:hypothetical protein
MQINKKTILKKLSRSQDNGIMEECSIMDLLDEFIPKPDGKH